MKKLFVAVLACLGILASEASYAETSGYTGPATSEHPSAWMRLTDVSPGPDSAPGGLVATDRAGTVAFVYHKGFGPSRIFRVDLTSGTVTGYGFAEHEPTLLLYDDVGGFLYSRNWFGVERFDGSTVNHVGNFNASPSSTYTSAAGGVIEPDQRRVYFAFSNPEEFVAIDMDTFTRAGAVPSSNSSMRHRGGVLSAPDRKAHFMFKDAFGFWPGWITYDLATMTVSAGPTESQEVGNLQNEQMATWALDQDSGFGYFLNWTEAFLSFDAASARIARVNLSDSTLSGVFPMPEDYQGQLYFDEESNDLFGSSEGGCVRRISLPEVTPDEEYCLPGEWSGFRVAAALPDGRLLGIGWSDGYKLAELSTTPELALTRLTSVDAGQQFDSCLIVDEARHAIFRVSNASPGRVSRISESNDRFEEDDVTPFALPLEESQVACGVIRADGSQLFLGTNSSPARIVQVQVSPVPAIYSNGAVTLEAGEDYAVCAAIDDTAGFAYFVTYTSPARIIKMRVSPFERVGAITLEPGEDFARGLVLDPTNGKLVVGLQTSPARVVQIDLATFTRGSALTLPVEDQFISTGTFDSAGRLALFGTASVPGRVIAIDTQTFSHVGSFPLGEGDDYLTHFAFDTARRALFATTGTVPPRVVRFDTAEMLLRGSLPLDWDAPAGPIAVLEDAPRVIVSLSASGARTEPLFGLLSTSSKGASHGISVFLPERSEIEHIDFYSQHAVGSFELRIKDTNRTTKWRSFTRSNTTANGTISIPILEGSKPDLILDPGFYFLEWEVDTTEEIAAYHASALPTCIVEEHYPGAFSNDSTYTSHASSIAITYHALSSSAAAGWEMYE